MVSLLRENGGIPIAVQLRAHIAPARHSLVLIVTTAILATVIVTTLIYNNNHSVAVATSKKNVVSLAMEESTSIAKTMLSADEIRIIVDDVLLQFDSSRHDLLNMLENDYGADLSGKIFSLSNNQTKRLILSSTDDHNLGWYRLKRKLIVKCLKVLQDQHHRRSMEASTNASQSSTLSRRNVKIPFVWATGGHSAAAGHGNLFNESYTAFLERAVQKTFATAGLQFIGRNYAMGGMASTPELAMCVDAVYGLDIDVLSWDFGMTDGRNYERMEFYFYHAGLNPNHPAAVAFIAGRNSKGQRTALKHIEDLGMSALYVNEIILNQAIDAIPETNGLNNDEINQVALFARKFKCNGALEKAEPYCGNEKYTQTVCPNRKFKTSWHPGWKYQALIGNMIGLSLIELLHEALLEIRNLNVTDISTLLLRLQAEEDKEFANFTSAELTDLAKTLDIVGNKESLLNILYKHRGICRTGLLPSETRYLGILDESEKVAVFSKTDGYTSYEKGVPFVEAQKNPNTGNQMRLVYDTNARQQCEVPLNQDYKDFWFVQGSENWQSITLPNKVEIEHYGRNRKMLGVVAACLIGCPWGKCKEGDIRESHVASTDRVEFKINGVLATKFSLLNSCIYPSHDDGVFWKPNIDGRFEIEVDVKQTQDYIRFSTFVIY